jgi:hypothetical protein
MNINGTIICFDSTDQNIIQATTDQTSNISCIDGTDQFKSFGFSISKSTWNYTDAVFVQGQELSHPSPLSLCLQDYRRRIIDGTSYLSGSEPSMYDPVWIKYEVYRNSNDGTSWDLKGFRFREPMHPNVGEYYANMVFPEETGTYRLTWLYKRHIDSDTTAVNQIYEVTNWGNGAPSEVFE